MLEHYRRKRHRECDKTVEDVIARAEASSESIIVTLAAPPNEIVYANTAWEALCGWRLDEVKGRTCKLLQGPQTCTRALRELEFAIIRRQSIRVQLRNYRKDGDVFSNDLFLEPLTSRGRHGIITHLQGTLRQISDDQLIPMPRPPKFDADELLRKLQEQQPTTLAEAMLQTRYAQVITEPTAPYRIVAVNREWCDTCGFSSEEAIGETCGMLQGPGTCKNTLREISKACEVTPLPPPLPRPRPPLVHAPSPPPPPSHAHHPFSRRAGGTYS
jgi:two-component system phosphate regulon sensor histidine kinase PhoR